MKLNKYTQKINQLIESSTNIFIMGHRYLDLDAIGSSVGIYEYIKTFNKKATIIINDTKLEKGVKKTIAKFGNNYSIKRSSKIKNKISENSLLIIVDTNKQYLLQDPNLFDDFKNIIIIDHHDLSNQSIEKGLIIVDDYASSTCEMITELLDKENIKISEDVATLLLSGIVLDTNNFVIKTTTDTFKAAYILTSNGANPLDVQLLLKQDYKKYIERQKVITNVKIIKNIAITQAKSTLKYRREDLAKIADTLLQFDKIEASFVIGKLDDETIGISSRSTGKIDVGKILENFNGGGDENEAGAAIKDKSIKDVEQSLKDILKKY